MNVFRYETSAEEIAKTKGPKIFLAGPTVRGNQQHLKSWRFEAIEEFEKLGFGGSLIIPEFEDITKSDKGEKHLPLWEFEGLKNAHVIMFWIPRTKELIGLTTNHEFGFWLGKQYIKMVYGRPDDAYRIDYLDIMWDEVTEKLPIYNTLSGTIKASIELSKLYMLA